MSLQFTVERKAPKTLGEFQKNLEVRAGLDNHRLGKNCELIQVDPNSPDEIVTVETMRNAEKVFDKVIRASFVSSYDVREFRHRLQNYFMTINRFWTLEDSVAYEFGFMTEDYALEENQRVTRENELKHEAKRILKKVDDYANNLIHPTTDFVQTLWKDARKHAPQKEVIGFANHWYAKDGGITISPKVQLELIKIAHEVEQPMHAAPYGDLSPAEVIELLEVLEGYNTYGKSKGEFSEYISAKARNHVMGQLDRDYLTAKEFLEALKANPSTNLKDIRSRYDELFTQQIADGKNGLVPMMEGVLSNLTSELSAIDTMSLEKVVSEREGLDKELVPSLELILKKSNPQLFQTIKAAIDQYVKKLDARFEKEWNEAKKKAPNSNILGFVDYWKFGKNLDLKVKEQLIYLSYNTIDGMNLAYTPLGFLRSLSPEQLVALTGIVQYFNSQGKSKGEFSQKNYDYLHDQIMTLINPQHYEYTKALDVLDALKSTTWTGLAPLRDEFEAQVRKRLSDDIRDAKDRAATKGIIGFAEHHYGKGEKSTLSYRTMHLLMQAAFSEEGYIRNYYLQASLPTKVLVEYFGVVDAFNKYGSSRGAVSEALCKSNQDFIKDLTNDRDQLGKLGEIAKELKQANWKNLKALTQEVGALVEEFPTLVHFNIGKQNSHNRFQHDGLEPSYPHHARAFAPPDDSFFEPFDGGFSREPYGSSSLGLPAFGPPPGAGVHGQSFGGLDDDDFEFLPPPSGFGSGSGAGSSSQAHPHTGFPDLLDDDFYQRHALRMQEHPEHFGMPPAAPTHQTMTDEQLAAYLQNLEFENVDHQ